MPSPGFEPRPYGTAVSVTNPYTRWAARKSVWAYREIPLSTTGVSPFQLLYGRQPQGPLSVLKSTWTVKHYNLQLCTTPVSKYLEDLKCKLEKAAEQAKLVSTVQQEKMAYYHNLRSSDRVFKVGEKRVASGLNITPGLSTLANENNLRGRCKELKDHEKQKGETATTIQCFLYSSLLSTNKEIVSLNPVKNMNAEDLYSMTLEILSLMEKLKELLCEVTSLATPDANLPFQVHCDASDYGVGCCLIQQDTEGIYTGQ
ncbi:retrovirus-related Pol polyprotein from transposon opus [Trichonephila clavipes]|nr:retrovirus-related Pol polyprotein from transposon opus [Trichonephila clavipes]